MATSKTEFSEWLAIAKNVLGEQIDAKLLQQLLNLMGNGLIELVVPTTGSASSSAPAMSQKMSPAVKAVLVRLATKVQQYGTREKDIDIVPESWPGQYNFDKMIAELRALGYTVVEGVESDYRDWPRAAFIFNPPYPADFFSTFMK